MEREKVIDEIIEKTEIYTETIDEIIEENKCNDCENLSCGIAQKGMCRLAILNDLKKLILNLN